MEFDKKIWLRLQKKSKHNYLQIEDNFLNIVEYVLFEFQKN